MAEISVFDLNLAGLDLLQDREIFLDELSDAELLAISGGIDWDIPPKKGVPIKSCLQVLTDNYKFQRINT